MISGADHLVLTVASIEESLTFYCDVLGMRRIRFGGGRWAAGIDDFKINLHEAGREFEPHAISPTPGSADVCFRVDDVDSVLRALDVAGVAVE